jgi:hypothetical protein
MGRMLTALLIVLGILWVLLPPTVLMGQNQDLQTEQKACCQAVPSVATANAMSPETAYESSIHPIADNIETEMRQFSWRPGCPVAISDLRLIRLTYWGFDSAVHTGELVVHESIASEVSRIFGELFAIRFPFFSMKRIEAFSGDDDASMNANNTSAFNCRVIKGRKTYSRHAYGLAIDINPVQNPYDNGTTVSPPSGQSYLSRSSEIMGMITAQGPVVSIFYKYGWKWGGAWKRTKDYQHFERYL